MLCRAGNETMYKAEVSTQRETKYNNYCQKEAAVANGFHRILEICRGTWQAKTITKAELGDYLLASRFQHGFAA